MADVDLFMTRPTKNSAGGDMELSAPKINEDGERIVDLGVSYGADALKQIAYTRIRTQAPDWLIHPNMGGNLEDLIGEPNTRNTAQRGVKMIRDALTYGEFLSVGEFTVKAVPVNKEEILFIVRIDNWLGEEVVLPIQFNYNYGMKLVEG